MTAQLGSELTWYLAESPVLLTLSMEPKMKRKFQGFFQGGLIKVKTLLPWLEWKLSVRTPASYA